MPSLTCSSQASLALTLTRTLTLTLPLPHLVPGPWKHSSAQPDHQGSSPGAHQGPAGQGQDGIPVHTVTLTRMALQCIL